MHQVFISYSHTDRDKAAKLAAALQAWGYTVWWDPDLLGGDDFRSQIAAEIQQSTVVLALFSERSTHSGWVLDEAGRAAQSNKLVPVLIEPVPVPLGFGQIHHCDLRE